MNHLIDRVTVYLKNPYSIFSRFFTGKFHWLSDKVYLRLLYRGNMGKKLDLRNPQSFSEKLQWLKLYDRKPIYTKFVDKESVKPLVSKLIGEDYIIPTLGVWDSPEKIEWEKLPTSFVLKCTHDSGGLVICKNKANLNKTEAIKFLNEALRRDFYYVGREWPYKDVPHRIIAEQFIERKDAPGDLHDYKFFCFDGVVKFFKIDFNRFIDHRANYYNPRGQLLPFGETACPPDYSRDIPIPRHLQEMISLAQTLSKGISFVRVDFYEVDDRVFFGEMTFFPGSGIIRWTDDQHDREIGNYITLPSRNNEH